MIIFSIYGTWKPYDVVQKTTLVDWIDKKIVQDSSCYEIRLKHSSVYTIFNFIYIRSAQKKMGVVHHKQHPINYS
jgi:transposase-like protein